MRGVCACCIHRPSAQAQAQPVFADANLPGRSDSKPDVYPPVMSQSQPARGDCPQPARTRSLGQRIVKKLNPFSKDSKANHAYGYRYESPPQTPELADTGVLVELEESSSVPAWELPAESILDDFPLDNLHGPHTQTSPPQIGDGDYNRRQTYARYSGGEHHEHLTHHTNGCNPPHILPYSTHMGSYSPISLEVSPVQRSFPNRELRLETNSVGPSPNTPESPSLSSASTLTVSPLGQNQDTQEFAGDRHLAENGVPGLYSDPLSAGSQFPEGHFSPMGNLNLLQNIHLSTAFHLQEEPVGAFYNPSTTLTSGVNGTYPVSMNEIFNPHHMQQPAFHTTGSGSAMLRSENDILASLLSDPRASDSSHRFDQPPPGYRDPSPTTWMQNLHHQAGYQVPVPPHESLFWEAGPASGAPREDQIAHGVTPTHAKRKRISVDCTSLFPPVKCGCCNAVFTGKFSKGNLKRHIKHKHAAAPVLFPCRDLSCQKVYKRDCAQRNHEWKKHRMLDVKPEKRKERRIYMPEMSA